MAPPLRLATPMIENASSMDRPVATPRRLTRARIVALVVVGLLLIGGAIAFPAIRRWSRADRAVDATAISIGTVTRGDLRRDVSVQGRVVAALHPTLIAPAAGFVSLRTNAGAVVRKGDVLAIIDSPELRSALQQASAQLLSLQADAERQKILARQADARAKQLADLARTRLGAAKRALLRAETLHKEGLLNRGDYEKAQDDVHVAELELEPASREIGSSQETGGFDVRTRALQASRQQTATAELQKKFEDLTIRAPFDGMIASVNVNDRDSVTANQAILNIVNLSSLELELTIPEEYAGDTRIGTPVTIAFGAEEKPGHITAISPEVVGNQVTGRAVPDGGWPAGMKQSQRLTTRLVFESKRDVVKVPRGAWLESGGGRSVWVVDGKSATKREIGVGAASVSEVEIVSGLQVGERIVTSDTSAFGNARSVILQ
jgi:HlyD family secretion protein